MGSRDGERITLRTTFLMSVARLRQVTIAGSHLAQRTARRSQAQQHHDRQADRSVSRNEISSATVCVFRGGSSSIADAFSSPKAWQFFEQLTEMIATLASQAFQQRFGQQSRSADSIIRDIIAFAASDELHDWCNVEETCTSHGRDPGAGFTFEVRIARSPMGGRVADTIMFAACHQHDPIAG